MVAPWNSPPFWIDTRIRLCRILDSNALLYAKNRNMPCRTSFHVAQPLAVKSRSFAPIANRFPGLLTPVEIAAVRGVSTMKLHAGCNVS